MKNTEALCQDKRSASTPAKALCKGNMLNIHAVTHVYDILIEMSSSGRLQIIHNLVATAAANALWSDTI